jgi:hypothetical protein
MEILTVLTHAVTMVGGEDDDRFVHLPRLSQCVEDSADLGVRFEDLAVVPVDLSGLTGGEPKVHHPPSLARENQRAVWSPSWLLPTLTTTWSRLPKRAGELCAESIRIPERY